jgi:hypothetical protein
VSITAAGAQGLQLQSFFDSTAGKFKTDVGKRWAAEVYARRAARQAAAAAAGGGSDGAPGGSA